MIFGQPEKKVFEPSSATFRDATSFVSNFPFRNSTPVFPQQHHPLQI
jgi:hypothetical protein